MAAPRAPGKALSLPLSLSLPQCQGPASWACLASYAPTGTGRHMAGHQPARPACSTHPGQPAHFLLPTCRPLPGAEPGTLLGHAAPGLGGPAFPLHRGRIQAQR